MARRSGGSNKSVEEKRRNLPIYQHYTLSPGKTKSHHPEAKCNHCLREFVCGSKQRLIRHLRKCDSISNPDQIIVDTLNTLARNSATGTLNHSILEASNLLPSQIPPQLQAASRHHQFSYRNSNNNHVAQQQATSSTSTTTDATSTTANNNLVNSIVDTSSNNNDNNHHHHTPTTRSAAAANNHSNDNAIANGGSQTTPQSQKARRGRKPGSTSFNSSISGIQVTTGIDGKAHFTTVSLTSSTATNSVNQQAINNNINTPTTVQHNVHNGRSHSAATNNHHSNNSNPIPTGHLAGGIIPNSIQTTSSTPTINNNSTKLNSDNMDKAYLKLVLTRNLPLSLCDTKEFQSWMRTLSNDYKPPNSINLIMLNLVNEAQIASQKITNILVKAPKKTINLELQFWLDEQRGHLWYAIFANTDQKRFLVSVRDMFEHVYNLNSIISECQQPQMDVDGVTPQPITSSVKPERVVSDFIDEFIKKLGSDRMNSLILSSSRENFRLSQITSRACLDLTTQHPSIVTYDCWWQFTNRLCSDIIGLNDNFQELMKNSKRLMNFILHKPNMDINIEKYRPFIGITGSLPRASPRWHSHLVCYLLCYIKNNRENICKILEALYSLSLQNQKTSDNNNNNNNNSTDHLGNNSTTVGGDINNTGLHNNHDDRHSMILTGTSQLCQQQSIDYELHQLQSLVKMNDYWNNLNLALNYLKPIQEIQALTSLPSIAQQQQQAITTDQSVWTQRYSPNVSTSLMLSEYTHWFLGYGKQLIESWRQSPDVMKHQLIGRYLSRFNNSVNKFKLLFASYLLNPKYRCAYMTQKAKAVAIEEILNIASEFMTEESDGLTIFDQWKLYLNREEPYDLNYDENRSTPFEWWMSLPCAESIRRVALRILRLRAFVQPKPDSIFQQLYLYEDETSSKLDKSTFEEIAILRYFYDHEDKVGLLTQNHTPSAANTNNSNLLQSNIYRDRNELGLVHQTNNDPARNTNSNSEEMSRLMPVDCFDSGLGGSNGHQPQDSSLCGQQSFSSSLSDIVIEPYSSDSDPSATSNLSIDDHIGYETFVQFVDYNDIGVVVTEEPTEKKRKKWTAQEILSKCQSNSVNSH